VARDEHGTGHDFIRMSSKVIPRSNGTAAHLGEIHPVLVDVVVIQRKFEERIELVGKPTILCHIMTVLRHQHDEGTVRRPIVVLDQHWHAELEQPAKCRLAAVAVLIDAVKKDQQRSAYAVAITGRQVFRVTERCSLNRSGGAEGDALGRRSVRQGFAFAAAPSEHQECRRD
jgi:hypothetical protein